MRRKMALSVAALCVPLVLTGCSALGFDTSIAPRTSGTGAPGPVSDAGWVTSTHGTPTPTPSASLGTGGTTKPALPPVSFLPVDPACVKSWTVDPVLIPMTVEPAAGSFTVSWPRQYASNYRITAVPQPLKAGNQPAYTWQDVPATTGCTVTTKLSGLKPGTPYVIWLDAPNTGYERDGTRHPYSGKSGVVHPL
jgi:hypothetical protein